MATEGRSYDRIRDIVTEKGDGELAAGDEAVLRSILGGATEEELCEMLVDFFDVEPLTFAIYEEFLARGSAWGESARQRLVQSLTFCGFDEESAIVAETLR